MQKDFAQNKKLRMFAVEIILTGLDLIELY